MEGGKEIAIGQVRVFIVLFPGLLRRVCRATERIIFKKGKGEDVQDLELGMPIGGRRVSYLRSRQTDRDSRGRGERGRKYARWQSNVGAIQEVFRHLSSRNRSFFRGFPPTHG